MTSFIRIGAIAKAIQTVQAVQTMETMVKNEKLKSETEVTNRALDHDKDPHTEHIIEFHSQYDQEQIINAFLPLILAHNPNILNELIEKILADSCSNETGENNFILNLTKLLFVATPTASNFPPIEEVFIDSYNNLQLYWDTTINLLHIEGHRDELTFILYNSTKNEVEHKGIHAISEDTEVDFAFAGVNDDWEGDMVYVWAVWFRYNVNNPLEVIAHSDFIFLTNSVLG